MILTVDNFGRILIPKKARQAYGLEAGTKVELSFDQDVNTIVLKPAEPLTPTLIVDEFGIPTFDFHTDEVWNYDFTAAVRESREERDRKVAGL